MPAIVSQTRVPTRMLRATKRFLTTHLEPSGSQDLDPHVCGLTSALLVLEIVISSAHPQRSHDCLLVSLDRGPRLRIRGQWKRVCVLTPLQLGALFVFGKNHTLLDHIIISIDHRNAKLENV